MQQLVLFDYNSLDTDTRTFVQEKAQSIHARLKRTAEDIIAIGQDLIEVNEKLAPHGKFHAWLRSEFDMTRQSAYRFIAVARKFGTCNIMLQHSPTVLYSLLDAPDAVIEMVETKQIPATLPAIREATKQQEQVQTTPEPTHLNFLGLQEEALPPVTHVPAYDPEQAGPKGYEFWKAEKDEEALPEQTEEDRYMTAVDMGTLDYYYDDLRRDAIQRDKEERSLNGRNIDNIPIAVPHISSKNNEWYTPSRYVEAAREVMGSIDLDPASNPTANETIKASVFYDIHTNGLDKDWTGHVWLNPPYGRSEDGSNQDVWSSRLIEQYDKKTTTEAILLVNAAVDTKWFQRLFDYPICFPDHRINFTTPEPTTSGSTHGSALIYFGPNTQKFVEVFSKFGAVVKRW